MNKAEMSLKERTARSRLTKLVSTKELLRGSITFRERVCGKPNCICARGAKHKSMYLSCSKDGHIKQVYIPEKWQQRVEQWVSQYKDSRELLEQISDLYLTKVTARKE